MQPSTIELLRDLQVPLSRLGLRWYVFGAQALAVHGIPRHTLDVDVTVEVPQSQLGALLTLLEQAGFRLRISEGVDSFVAQTRVLPLFHARTGLPMDLVLAGPGPEEEFLSRATHVDIGETRVPVVSAEDLVVLKVLSGRDKDRSDIRSVLRRQGKKLDADVVRSRLRTLEQLVDRSDLVPEFEQLVEAYEQERRNRGKKHR
ncbi:MAG: nucleotidyl transferase AbiEii/AbiGii toxin family protein [Myxococcota bacterium]